MLNMYVHMSISLCEHYCVQYCVHTCCRLHLAEGMMGQDDSRRFDDSWMWIASSSGTYLYTIKSLLLPFRPKEGTRRCVTSPLCMYSMYITPFMMVLVVVLPFLHYLCTVIHQITLGASRHLYWGSEWSPCCFWGVKSSVIGQIWLKCSSAVRVSNTGNSF